ncbi:MAG TPA: DUF1553 domain-containing protein [Verrucomicrobiae bacterium]|jgi:hypothetical protein|nr:DUF1553 domain-containing protein [Verrucomicrobiae bacterium]
MTRTWLQLCALSIALITGADAKGADATVQYNRDIRPILSDRCFRCHGPDAQSRKAKLRLDDSVSAFGPRKDPNEHAIVPGHPDQSVLIRRIFAKDPDDVMPPPSSYLTLSDSEKETLRRWVAQGAKYEPHWAFVPLPGAVAVPQIKNKSWARNEIDNFIAARLEKAGIKPSREASKTRWIRRVTYDLNGLPPTPAEVDAFLADKSPKAYEKVVDILLASPHYGERMAVPWLDAARYADSYGYQNDALCPTWPYRDWVVSAYNRNLPYDQFLKEQLAGDLLPHPTREQRLATAFSRLHRQTAEGGSVEAEWRTEYVADRVNTFSYAVMGLTFECARCHDHKFDPITQRDYYSLSAFFNSIDEYGLYNDAEHVPTPSILLPNSEQEKAMTATAGALATNTEEFRATLESVEPEFQSWLKQTNLTADIPGLVAHYTFDWLTETNRFANEVNPPNLSSSIAANTLVPGKFGQAVQFTGDDEIAFPGIIGSLQPWDQYSVVFWLRIPEALTNAIIFHQSAGTDVGFHGTELSLEDGKLFFAIKRFWPGNALAVRSRVVVPRDQWVQIGVSYDGSGDAGGMRLFVDGSKDDLEIVRNRIYKSPENGGSGFVFGARFRTMGLKGAALDELRVYNRPLAAVEFAQLHDGHSLEDAVASRDATVLREFFAAARSRPVAESRLSRAESVKKYLETRNPVQETSVMEELPQPRPTFVLARGRYDAPKTDAARVTRTTPGVLPPFPAGAPHNRLGLAEWLTEPNHPLTARVAVNRYWQMIFGRGIVSTSENFGTQGAAPTHPQLLDWLARDFINSGWDTKALLKKIVLSSTYRQDSVFRRDLKEKDPENLLLSRGPSHRLSAEMVRDTALAASGLLDDKMGGPPVSPYMPGDLWREANSMSPAYHQSVGGDLYRRSLYTVIKRTAPMPDMTAFDAPSREVCVLKRSATGTPQQAFVLLNDTQYVEAARVLAQHALKEGGPDTAKQIRFAFRRLAGRDPDAMEARVLAELWTEQEKIFLAEPARAKQLIAVGDTKADESLDVVKLAAATVVTQAILNLDATVWKR